MGIQQGVADLSAGIDLLREGQDAVAEAKIRIEDISAPYQAQIDAKAAAEEEGRAIQADVQSLLGRLASLTQTLKDGEEASHISNTSLQEAAGRAGSGQFAIERALEPTTRSIGRPKAEAVIQPGLQEATQLWSDLNKGTDQSPRIALGFACASTDLEKITELVTHVDRKFTECLGTITGIGIKEGFTDIDPGYPAKILARAGRTDLEVGVAIVELESQAVVIDG